MSMELLKIEKVETLLGACPDNLLFADLSGSLGGLYDIGGPVIGGEDSQRFQKIAIPAEYEDGSDPRWKLLEAAPDLARLALSLSERLAASGARAETARAILTGVPQAEWAALWEMSPRLARLLERATGAAYTALAPELRQ